MNVLRFYYSTQKKKLKDNVVGYNAVFQRRHHGDRGLKRELDVKWVKNIICPIVGYIVHCWIVLDGECS